MFLCCCQDLLKKAIDASMKARRAWEKRPQEERSRIFLDAADLLANKYRMDLMAATMLGQVSDPPSAKRVKGALYSVQD